MKLRYAIIENEELARRNLQAQIEQARPGAQMLFYCETIEESIAAIREHPEVSLIFMDIELDDGNCFEIFRRVEVKAPVVFTTAYDEYAIKAFKVNSIDYLLKPIEQADVETAIAKFEMRQAPARLCRRGRDHAAEQAAHTGAHHQRHRLWLCERGRHCMV